MSNKMTIMLGLGVAIALVVSAGVANGMMGRTGPPQSAPASGVAAGPGYGGGMMGGTSSYSGSTIGGGSGGMMGGYHGMMTGYYGMMGGNGGMMGHFSQFMGNHSSYMQNRTANGAFVTIVDYGFYPASLTIPKGTTVTWVNMDFVQHTVTSGTEQAPTSLFDSHELNHMQGFSYTFSTPGTYVYYCDVHPDMTATVTVT